MLPLKSERWLQVPVSTLYQLGEPEQVFDLSDAHFPNNLTVFLGLMLLMPGCTTVYQTSLCTDNTEGLVKMQILIQESWWRLRLSVFYTLSAYTDAARFWTTFCSKIVSSSAILTFWSR